MKRYLRIMLPLTVILLSGIAAGPSLHAQIVNQIQAHVNHSFMIGDKMLPAGNYTFRMEGNSDLGVMTAQNSKGDYVAQFQVRQSIDNRTPTHSELVFKKYGNTEFLTRIYEQGSKNGVRVTENSNQEAQLVKSGQQGIEHTEVQQ